MIEPYRIVGIDGYDSEQRKSKYDNKKCDCGKLWDGKEHGWLRPFFESYMDISYVCPDCIAKYQAEYKHKNKRLKELPAEIKEAEDEYCAAPYIQDEVYRNEDGELYYSACEEDITLKELKKKLDYYEEHESEIEAQRKKKDDLWKKVESLREEKSKCEAGSGYNPHANT